jgi:hypothetical protein
MVMMKMFRVPLTYGIAMSLAVPMSLAMLGVAGATEPMAAGTAGATAVAGAREYREVTLPAGTVLPLTLDTTVASNTNRVEDRVSAHLRRPVVRNGVTVLPAGTAVGGFVTDARAAGKVQGRGRIGVRFTTVSVGGEQYRVQTSRVVHEAPGTKKKDAAKIGIPAGAGALIGGLVGGGKGALIGGAAGGGAGTAVVLSTHGQNMRLGRGASLGVRLLKPVTVRIPE